MNLLKKERRLENRFENNGMLSRNNFAIVSRSHCSILLKDSE